MRHLYRHRSTLGACRFFLCSRTKCSKASSMLGETDESQAKVIYSVAPTMGHHKVGHLECNARIPVILTALEKAKLTPKFRGSEIIQLQHFRTATVEDIASIHSRSYITSLKKAMEQAKASEQGILTFQDFGPTYVTPSTFDESLVAVGAGLSLVDSVVAASKIMENPPVGFALIRPPGHHAVPTEAMGFCIFNNVAIAARYAQRAHGLKRVFIVDFGVYHGNGTNDAFYDDPEVFFLSTHQEGGFPHHAGKIEDIGRGNGERATLNLPLPQHSGDIAMRTAFDEVIVPSAQRFKPDIILVSAGYDGLIYDPVSGFQLKTGTYYNLSLGIKQLAKDVCGGRCVFFLEGGYYLSGLSHSVTQSFRAFIGEPSIPFKFDNHNDYLLHDEPSCEVKQAIERVKHLHSL